MSTQPPSHPPRPPDPEWHTPADTLLDRFGGRWFITLESVACGIYAAMRKQGSSIRVLWGTPAELMAAIERAEREAEREEE